MEIKIYNESNLDTLKRIPDESVDMILTSPPYDSDILRQYDPTKKVWGWDDFIRLIPECYRVLKPGCVLVWVVDDATVNGGETGTKYRQVVWILDNTPFLLHDTMIYAKNSPTYPPSRDSKRYGQIFEHMFVFSKGQIRKDITLLADKPNKYAGHTSWGKCTGYNRDGKYDTGKKIDPVPEFSLRNNIWTYTTACERDRTGHPAVFPEYLAMDNILSWTLPGDLVYDPFMGSGTTAKACLMSGRKCIGSEISEEYYHIIMERLNTAERYDGKVGYKRNRKDGKTEGTVEQDNGEEPLF